MASEESLVERSVDRRKLLRRAGTVAAGVAGAGVASAVVASPAQATDGSAILQGQKNTGTSTGIETNEASAASLTLTNTAVVDSGGYSKAGPSLLLTPNGDYVDESTPGSIGMAGDGKIWTVTEQNWSEYLHSTANSNVTVPIIPQRVFDTRYADSRSRIISGSLDSSGRVLGGGTITVDLGDYVAGGDVVFGNLTAVQPTVDGYATVYPAGWGKPEPSSLNYMSSLFALSNAVLSGIGWDADHSDLVSIYVHRTTHLILDVSAFAVRSPGQINPDIIIGFGATGGMSVKTARPHVGDGRTRFKKK